MKIFKKILAIAVIAIMGNFLYKSCQDKIEFRKTEQLENGITKAINSMIDTLQKKTKNIFCHEFYSEIQERIDENYENGSLGERPFKVGNIWKMKKNDKNNKQWKDILSKSLYNTYSPKFVEQAMHVFKGSVWKNDDLILINKITKSLAGSTYLDQNSETAKQFKSINGTIKNYYAVTKFILNCKSYTFNNYSIDAEFPNQSANINKSRTINYPYLNNCTRLKDGLDDIPLILYKKHKAYLKEKIINNFKLNLKQIYPIAKDLTDKLYTPLYKQIKNISNDIYGINIEECENDKEKIISMLDQKFDDAYPLWK